MANKPRKRCSSLLPIKEMQIKTHTTLLDKIKNLITRIAGRMWRPSYAVVKWCSCCGRDSNGPSERVAFDPADAALVQMQPRYIPKRNENIRPCKNSYTNVHSSVICDTNRWKQPKCPPTNERVSKTWHFPTMEYYSAVESSEVLTYSTTRVNPENTMYVKEATHTHTHLLYDGIFKKYPEETNL